MSGLEDLTNSLFGVGGSVPTPTLAEQKQLQVAAAGAQKQAQLNGMPTASDLMTLVSGKAQNNGRPVPVTDPYQRDLAELTPSQLIDKYGNDTAMRLLSEQATARSSYSALQGHSRDVGATLGDLATGTGLGLFDGVAGIGALGIGGLGAAGVLPKSAGPKAAQLIGEANNWVQRNLQSNELNLDRARASLDTQTDVAENRILAERAKAEGANPLATDLERLGQNAVDSVAQSLKSGRVLTDGVAGLGGGLIAGGALGKGAGLLGEGALSLASDSSTTAARMLSAAAKTPAAEYLAEHGGIITGNAAMMGGGAYQDAASQALDQGAAPDQANAAGLIAAAIQTPWALATGGISAKFRANPLEVSGVADGLGNAGKSTLEGVLQATGGQLAQNIGAKATYAPDQDLSEGLGEQAGNAALYGLGAAGAFEAPGLAAHAVGLAGKGALEAGKTLVKPLANLGDQIAKRQAQASPVTPEKVQAGLAQASASVGGLQGQVDAFRNSDEGKQHRYEGYVARGMDPAEARAKVYGERPTDDAQAIVDEHMGRVAQALQHDPGEAEQQSSPRVAEAVRQAPDRFAALDAVSKIAQDKEASPDDRIAAGFYLKDTLNKIKDATDVSLPKLLQHLPEDHSAVPVVHMIGEQLANVGHLFESDPEIKKAISGSLDLAAKTQAEPLTGHLAQTVLKLAEHAPEKVDPAVAEQILKHATQFRLTDEQKSILQAAASFARENQAKIEQARQLGVKTNSLVSHEIQGADPDPSAKGLSAKQHMLGVLAAVRSGDTDVAREKLQRFMAFAQHMDNKVGALNASLDQGGTSEKNPVKFPALDSATGEWKPEGGKQWFDPTHHGSVRTAQMTALDARATVRLANSLARAFPKLGVEPIHPTELKDSQILEEKAANTVERYRNGVEPTQTAPSTPVEPGEASAEVAQSETQRDAEQAPQAEPPKSAESGATERELTPIEAAYPSLIGSHNDTGGPQNWFVKAFWLPAEQPKSRLVGEEEPVRHVVSEIAKLGSEIHGAYVKYLTELVPVERTLFARLDTLLNTPLSKTFEGKTYQEALLSGMDVNRLKQGKVLNLTEVRDGKVQYHQELVQGAMLAGMQWLLSSAKPSRRLEAEDVAKILKKDIAQVDDDMVEVLNTGRSKDDAVQSLSAQIARFWGVNADPNAREGYTRGIPEAMAKEMLTAMAQAGLVKFRDDLKIDNKTYPRVVSQLDVKLDEATREGLRKLPTAIERVVRVDPEEIRFIGSPPQDVAQTQLRNRLIANTPQQKQVLERAQTTPHWVNPHTTAFANNLAEAGLLRLFGRGNPDSEHAEANWNTNYRESVRGFNRTVSGAFEALGDMLAELDQHGSRELPIFYRYNFNRVNRLQMEGDHNPQASKLMREWILPTRSTLDLTSRDGQRRFMLAMAQAWGIKIHKEGVDVSVQKAFDRAEKDYKPAIDLLAAHLRNPEAPLTPEHVDLLRKTFGGKDGDPPSPVALHAALEYARFREADPQARKAFATQAYVEADGVTDGVVNALVHYATGKFTADWVRLVAKGGLSFLKGQTLAGHIQKDSADLYQSTNDVFETLLKETRSKLQGNPPVRAQMDALLRVMTQLMPGDVNFNEDSDSIKLERGVVKNPMTTTVYGAGAKGIASKLTGDMLGNYYKLISQDPAKARLLLNDIQRLTTRVTRSGKEGPWIEDRTEATNTRTNTGVDYTLTPDMVENLTQNVQRLFVADMDRAIQQNIGEVTPATTGLRKAIQVMSIFQHDAFKRAYDAKIKDLAANDPTWKEGDGLSQKELDGLLRQTMPLGPLVDTGTQSIYPAGSSNSIVGSELSRDTQNKFETQNYIWGPDDAGVSGIAYMNIAPGDGQMIQNIFTIPGSPEGGLPVYDGFHTKLDTMFQDSAKINEAVRQGWLDNPLDAVHRSYQQFLERASFGDLAPKTWGMLYRALKPEIEAEDREEASTLDPAQLKARIEAKVQEAIQQEVEGLGKSLEWMSRETQLRHEVLGDVATSTDHMAGMESPFQSHGIDVSGEPEEVAEKLNALYDQKAQEQKAEQSPLPEAPETKPETKTSPETSTERLGTPDRQTGARVVEMTGVGGLARELNTPEVHRPLVNELIASLAKSGYRLVLGSADQIKAWAQANGKRLLADDQADGEVVHGYTVIGDKLIYLNSPSSETLVHELVHAATLEKVFAFYDDPKSLTMDQRRTVKRLEVLLNQWMGQANDLSGLGWDAQGAYLDALDTVKGHLNDTSKSESVRKANALNEFMAWNLANPHLVEQGSQTKVTSDWRKWGWRILQAIKNLVWSKPETVPKSLYQALRFDTSVLLDGNPSVQSQLSDVMLFHSRTYGSDDYLDRLKQGFQRIVVSVVRDQPNEAAMAAAQDKVLSEALDKATDVVKYFRSAGFEMTPQAVDVMLSLVAAFASDAQLDPSALARAHELHAHVVKHLDVGMFMRNPEGQDPNDELQANRKLQAILGANQAAGLDAKGRSAMLPAFLALAMAHDGFRQALAQIEVPKTVKDGSKTVDAWAGNLGNASMDHLARTLSGEGQSQPNVQAALDVVTNRLAESAQSQRDYIAQNTNVVSRAISDANDRLVGLIQMLSGKGVDALQTQLDQTSNPAIRGLLEVSKFVVSMANEQDGAAASEGIMSTLNRSQVAIPFQEFVNELIGRTQYNASIVDMVKELHTFVSRVRQQFREHLPELLASKFNSKLTDEDWTHLHYALGKTDLALLRSTMTPEQVLSLLGDPVRVQSMISDHERLVRQLAPQDGEKISEKTRQLARFMINGVHGRNLLSNAEAIARLNGERRTPMQTRPADQLVQAIDRLTTLHALDSLTHETQLRVASLVQHEPQGVRFLFDYLAGQRKDEQAKLTTDMARINHYKGYLPSENQEGLNLQVVDDRDHQKMINRGYIRVGDYKGSRAELGKPSRGYYFSALGQSVFDQGVLQNVRQTASGVDPTRGYSYGHVRTAGRITDPSKVRELAQNLHHDTGAEPLRAIYDGKGKAVAFERMIDPMQEARLNRSTDLARMIGVWRGRQVEEAMAGQYNNRLIDALHDMWQRDGIQGQRKNEFVNLLETHKLDPVTRDAVSLFTPETLRYVQDKFGGEGFWVRRDMLNDAIGRRRASVGDFWTGVTRWPEEQQQAFRKIATGVFGEDAYRTLVTAERTLQGLVSKAKQSIVVKSIIVPVGNMVGNLYQLSARGVPLKATLEGVPKKTSEIEGYVKRSLRAIDLEAELRASTNNVVATRKIQAELQSIQDTDRRMSIWPLIEAGEFSSISQGLTHHETPLFQGKLQEHFERLVDGMPESMKTAGRYALITKDTALYQGLHKAINYGDFIAKAILFDDLTKRQGMDPKTALGKISEEFINYDRLSGRFRSYMESMGVTWFWNYKVRITKIAVSMLRNNPLQAILTGLVPTPPLVGHVGLPTSDNFFSVLGDGRLDHTIGPGMGLHGFTMNPWVNMTNSVH